MSDPKNNANMKDENKDLQLSDEDLESVSGGFPPPVSIKGGSGSCPGANGADGIDS